MGRGGEHGDVVQAADLERHDPGADDERFDTERFPGGDLFLHRFYEGQSVAANDIGAITYLADLHLLDLAGLASREVAFLERSHQLNAAQVKSLTDARGTAIAVVYPGWFEGIRDNWSPAGEWKIPNNVICAGDTVSFYAVDPSRTPELLERLRAFAPELPRAVTQSGEYLKRAEE